MHCYKRDLNILSFPDLGLSSEGLYLLSLVDSYITHWR